MDRRAVSLRWMAGIVLMGLAAAGLLGGALLAALGQRPRFAGLPVFVTPRVSRPTIAEEDRGDRDPARTDGRGGGGSALRIEQLNDTGAMRPFTRVSARLSQIGSRPRAEEIDRSVAGGEDRQRAAASPSELPPIILFGTSHRPPPRNVSAYAEDRSGQDIARVIGRPLNETILVKSPAAPGARRHVVSARAGDRLSSILGALAVGPDEGSAILTALARRRRFVDAPLAGGDVVTLVEEAPSPDTQAPHPMEVSVERRDGGIAAVARTDDGRYESIATEQTEREDHGPAFTGPDLSIAPAETLRDSLRALAQSNHVDEGLVVELIRLCGRDFDLDRPLAPTDATDILYAPDERGQPELVFAGLRAQGKTRRYYRFRASDDRSTDFYDEDGRSITTFLLRNPVVDGRLGDGFGWRTHPVLHDRRFHEGVDYAAPYGSPIAAAGAGVVEIIGQERGYGRYVRIRHDLGYETAYAHVAGFPAGLKVGDRVRQGETIAYVGSTGLSTGPHLYYEVWINGRRVDPLRIGLAGGRILQGDVLQQFQESARQIDRLIDVPQDVAATPGR
ncbi:M23 family metallopeptidase [Labrys wisconsinensis]|uniref:Murein DD-endopeptidase MepM/ murein hydrolase activator NlpD n=1 Tax=Labrys wisconsinensis TaxID=425677 RepID=A0ABU0J4K9_9HYPH|nr:M23 family metallopeptidase [Labrys wisconsinensis]MDQ0468570.1 murein DD-endopeptidase MepM/ murein hydrolase activator NlpD [Labrys wisconsinensis]